MGSLLLLTRRRKKMKLDLPFLGLFPSAATLTRASAGTFVNALGNIEQYANNAPRFDYNPVTHEARGILVEPQRTNLVWNSGPIGGTHWGQSADTSIELNAATAPDGTLTATKLIELGTNPNTGSAFESAGAVSGSSYCLSVFAKAGTTPIVQLQPTAEYSTPSWAGCVCSFDLMTGASSYYTYGDGVTNIQKGIEECGNGWYRCWISHDLVTTNLTSYGWTIGNYHSGDGSEVGKSVYLWGAQVETGSRPTSYIPTISSVVTRAADSLQFAVPAGVATLRYTFDDGSTQDVAVVAGAYTVPTNLDRPHIKRIIGL